jgi:hypothetical protein
MRRANNKERGSAMVEFTIAGIAAIAILISTIQIAIAMWDYHTMAYAAHETNRYVASHGRSCSTGGNNCTIYVSDIVTKLKSNAVGLTDSSLNMILTSQSGTTKSCFPISTCASDGTQWPPTSHMDYQPGNYTKMALSMNVNSMLVGLWYGMKGQRISTITLTSTSDIPIVF